MLLQMASVRYWEARDHHEAAVNLRQEIIKRYDAKNHMKINENRTFREGSDIVIEMKDASWWDTGKAYKIKPKREVEVYLGGKKAEWVKRDENFLLLTFKLKAERLHHDGNGGVKLEVRVIR